ncbi:LacI family DNA-binding transcriptional regulator [Alishewanella sp. HL-SH06]|uniref:LacI family DNA-binding transcriptional regulator n=1 Tax=Alishewanella sp. HL-SH06 TaxID=3461144 RepID=UPI0040421A94
MAKITLKSLAKHLGVSVATVSNAFNRPDQLSTDLRRHILAESEKLGFNGPNATARSLRTGRSDMIAILLADSLDYAISDPVASQLIKGIAEVLQQQGKDMLLLSGSKAVHSTAEAMPDGFIIYGRSKNPEQLDRVLASGKPMITVDCNLPDVGSVNIDNYRYAYDIAEYALHQQAGKVAVLGLRLLDSDRVCRMQPNELYQQEESIARRRLDGYLAAMQAQNRALPAEQVWHIPVNTHHYAETAAREALTQHPRPQLLLCMSDRIALGAIAVARQLGLRIPEDLRIVGFDGIEEAERAYPALTTIAQHSDEKGRTAARLLLSGQQQQHVLLDCELRLRDSC